MIAALIGLAIFTLAIGAVLFVAWMNYKSAKEIGKAATTVRDTTTAMVIDLSDAIAGLEGMVRELKREHDADRGKVYGAATPVPPNMPVLSGARHAAEPSGEYLLAANGFEPIPLREALHSNKVTFPPIVEECFLCACTMNGWSGPHCHYHQCSIPEGKTTCPFLTGA